MVRLSQNHLSEIQSAQQTQDDLIRELHAAEARQSIYLQARWLGAARKAETQLNPIRGRLSEARRLNVQLGSSAATESVQLALVVFRLLVMVGNVLLARMLGEKYQGLVEQLKAGG